MGRTVMLAMTAGANQLVQAPAAAAFYRFATGDRDLNVIFAHSFGSAGHLNCDNVWAAALNHFDAGEVTHFACLHADVVPDHGWLDVLLAEMDAHDADMVSAVVPLKNHEGLTSTGVDDTGDAWNPRRLTLHEVYQRAETFTHPAILLNTGLYVADLGKPWARATNPDGSLAVSHHMHNRVVKRDGAWRAEMRPEDWELSRLVRKHGGTNLYATRKVGLYHELQCYTNKRVWGTEQTDPLHPAPVNGEPAGVAA